MYIYVSKKLELFGRHGATDWQYCWLPKASVLPGKGQHISSTSSVFRYQKQKKKKTGRAPLSLSKVICGALIDIETIQTLLKITKPQGAILGLVIYIVRKDGFLIRSKLRLCLPAGATMLLTKSVQSSINRWSNTPQVTNFLLHNTRPIQSLPSLLRSGPGKEDG